MKKKAVSVDRAATKTRLINAGISVFSQSSFEEATTRQIAKAAGLNHAAIPYYFSTKEEFYEECLNYIVSIKEEFYEECLNYIVSIISSKFGDVRDLVQQSQQTSLTQDQALALLDLYLERLARFFLGSDDLGSISRIVLREMAAPTFAFKCIYEGMIKPMNEALTRIVSLLTHIDPQSQKAIIRTHSIMGQILVFQHARAVIVSRLGIKQFSENEIKEVIDTVTLHTHAIIQAYSRGNNDKP